VSWPARPLRRIAVDAATPDPAAMAEAARALRTGGVIAYPTDTFYGLAVDPRNDAAVRRLFDVKGRDPASAIALIAGDTAQASQAGAFGAVEEKLARIFWPGPLTLIVPAAQGMSSLLAGADATLGVRVPAHPVARLLALALGTCVTATSANLSGQPPPTDADAVAAALGDRVDVLLDAGAAPGGAPSTIVRIDEGRPTLVRAGAIAWSRVLESLE
jgi:L-threonylcarbamoyladenylate synthase